MNMKGKQSRNKHNHHHANVGSCFDVLDNFQEFEINEEFLSLKIWYFVKENKKLKKRRRYYYIINTTLTLIK